MNYATNIMPFPDQMTPVGFVYGPGGIYQQIPSKTEGAEPTELHICGPMRVKSYARTTDGSCWSKLVIFNDPDGREQQVLLPEDMAFATKLKLLKQKGLWIGVGSARKGFELLLSSWVPTETLTLVDCFGWTDDTHSTFMISPAAPLGDTKVIFHNDHVMPSDAVISAKGTAAQWRKNIGELCVGNPLMITAVSLAFAGPLLSPLKLEGGGLHFRGVSSSGKSTLLRLALSVWDKPSESQWLTTANALEPTLARKNSTLLAIDELGQASPKDVGAAAYMFGNGKGRSRLQSNGRAAASASWLTSVLSSGEISLGEHMAKTGETKMAGHEVRLLDISADTRLYAAFDELHDFPNARAFATHVSDQLAQFHGTAGRSFIGCLLSAGDALMTAQNHFDLAMRFMLDGLPACGPVENRAAKRFAVIAASGEMATKYGLTGWPAHSAFLAAREIFHDWLERRDQAAPTQFSKAELQSAVQQIVDFERGMNAHIWVDGGEAVAMPVAFRKEDLLYLPASTWANLRGSDDVVELAKALKQVGILKAGEGNNLQRKVPRSFPMAENRAYTFKREALLRMSEQSEQSEQSKQSGHINNQMAVVAFSDRSDETRVAIDPTPSPHPRPCLSLITGSIPTNPTVPT